MTDQIQRPQDSKFSPPAAATTQAVEQVLKERSRPALIVLARWKLLVESRMDRDVEMEELVGEMSDALDALAGLGAAEEAFLRAEGDQMMIDGRDVIFNKQDAKDRRFTLQRGIADLILEQPDDFGFFSPDLMHALALANSRRKVGVMKRTLGGISGKVRQPRGSSMYGGAARRYKDNRYYSNRDSDDPAWGPRWVVTDPDEAWDIYRSCAKVLAYWRIRRDTATDAGTRETYVKRARAAEQFRHHKLLPLLYRCDIRPGEEIPERFDRIGARTNEIDREVKEEVKGFRVDVGVRLLAALRIPRPIWELAWFYAAGPDFNGNVWDKIDGMPVNSRTGPLIRLTPEELADLRSTVADTLEGITGHDDQHEYANWKRLLDDIDALDSTIPDDLDSTVS